MSIGRLTPDTPTGFVRRCILIPDTMLSSVGGALAEMSNNWAWEVFGDLTVDETVILCKDIEDSYKDCISMLGSIAHFYGNIPDGYLPANGSAHDETDYPELYSYLGGTGGTFNTPDLTGVFIFGASGTSPLGDTFGESAVALTVLQLPSHNHAEHTHLPDLDVEQPVGVPMATSGLSVPGFTGARGGGQSHNNMPPAHSVTVAIRAID